MVNRSLRGVVGLVVHDHPPVFFEKDQIDDATHDGQGRPVLPGLDREKQAQRDIEALHHALHDLGVSDNLITEIKGRLRAQKKLLSTIFGLMFPTLLGCIHAYELTRTRGWDKHLPFRLLGALPKHASGMNKRWSNKAEPWREAYAAHTPT